MSKHDLGRLWAGYKISKKILKNDLAKKCMIPMGVTSDNVAK